MTTSSHVTIRPAVIQAQSLPGQIDTNLDHAAGLVEQAAGQGARGRDLRRQPVHRNLADPRQRSGVSFHAVSSPLAWRARAVTVVIAVAALGLLAGCGGTPPSASGVPRPSPGGALASPVRSLPAAVSRRGCR